MLLLLNLLDANPPDNSKLFVHSLAGLSARLGLSDVLEAPSLLASTATIESAIARVRPSNIPHTYKIMSQQYLAEDDPINMQEAFGGLGIEVRD